VAIVTGAAGGFGAAIADAFVRHGFRVAAVDVQSEGVEALEHRFGAERLLAALCDISDPAACAALVERVREHFGRIDILINNAALGLGIVRNDFFRRTMQIEDIAPESWQRMIDVNLNGAFFMARATVPFLRAQRWGRIINVTTSYATMLKPGFAPYGPAKAGLEAWTVSLAGELSDSGITVNVVVPGGPADTPMVPQESGFAREKLIAPALMAPPMLWLCSDETSDVTGMRFVAADWDSSVPPPTAARRSRGAAWPELCAGIHWPE
jgi:NAD(P)-dependent dehydrogenase (short-subunit alcohol dehydrogenase family)